MWFALFLLLALAGCGTWKPPSPEVRYEQARALLRGERYQAARTETERALEHVKPPSPWYWRLRLLRVEILQEQRQFKPVAAALAFQLPSGPQWNAEWARYRLLQANLEYRQGRIQEAAARLAEARTMAGAAGASDLLAEIELREASLATRQANFAEAEAEIRRVLAYAEPRNDPYLQVKANGNMGFVLLNAFRYEEAIPWFEKALAIARTLGAADSEPRAMVNLGWCFYRLGDVDKAMRYYQEAEAKFESTGNRYESQNCLGNVGSALLDRHEYSAAAANYKRALDIATSLGDRRFRAIWLNNLAKIAIQTGDLDAAERYNNEAWPIWKDLRDRHAEAYSIANAGWIAAGRRDFPRAEQLFRSLIAEASGDPVPLLDARAGLAHTLADRGRNREAEAAYRATDAEVEKLRSSLVKDEDKLTYFSSLIDFYRNYVDFMMARGRARDALAVAESSRARTLADRLELKRTPHGEITAAGFERAAAASGGTLLSYWVAPKGSYLWAVTRSGVKAFPLPSESTIRALVENYDALIQNARDPLTAESSAGRQLYEMLIAPARAMLPKNARVILVPDGPLYALNFETLPVFDGTPHYWIEDATLSITPSLGLLSSGAARREQARRSLLLIGNPVAPVAQYPALEFAGQEMASIEKNTPAFQRVVLEGPAAEPEAYAQSAPGRFGFIHFVAHAAANPQEPLESAVILSRHGTDYKLRARDVLNTRLNATLVTISACRSAGARTYAGEGLVGFAWAFLEAGARNVIAGLWDVNDRSTADLAARLYAELARSADPAGALQAAKLQLIHSPGAFQKPYYWGPFEVFTRQP
jgi:CHAT domain-containing protein/Tfp pilus assembly protein PilF